MENIEKPTIFKLQWHITERCNFRCRHCYQEKYDTEEMTFDQMEKVLDEYVKLLEKWCIPRERAFLTITGGEPFLHPDFYKFIARIYRYSDRFIWSILSNGSLVNRDVIKKLRILGLAAYQISLEGLEKENDKIRGIGNFKKATSALRLLIKEGIYTVVSLTFTKDNLSDISQLAYYLAKMGVNDFLVRRLVPWGSGAKMKELLLDSRELLLFYKKIQNLSEDLYEKDYKMKISLCCEAPFFGREIAKQQVSKIHQRGEFCAVTRGVILALLPNGDVLPCRRMPIVVGNIFKKSFEEIYYSAQLTEMRNKNMLAEKCRECDYFEKCLGGGRCMTYATTGRLDLPDPQCWLCK